MDLNIMKTLILESIIAENIIQIGMHQADDTVWKYERVSVPLNIIEQKCNEFIENMNQFDRQGPSNLIALKSLGKMLCDTLLTPNIKQILLTTDADNLKLIIDDGLVHIPWELVYLENQFLFERFNLGRMVKVEQNLKGTHREIDYPLSIWVLINAENELTEATAEGETLRDYIDDLNNFDPDHIMIDYNNAVFFDDVKESIHDYDIVHYAGHADYDVNDQIRCGWRLSDAHFSPNDIQELSGITTMPSLIFSNACQTARTSDWRSKSTDNNSYGLVHAFILAGVRHYIGTTWKVDDKQSNQFAIEFYHQLFQGLSIGESFRQAKLKLMNDNPEVPGWASYVLYGDPETVYRKKVITRGGKTKYFKTSSSNRTHKVLMLILCVLLIYPAFFISETLFEWIIQSDKEVLTLSPEFKCIQEKIREETQKERLIDEIEKNLQKTPAKDYSKKDSWTSFPLTVALVLGESLHCIPDDRISIYDIIFAIENSMQDYERIILVDQITLNDILEELQVGTSDLAQPKRKIQPDFYSANFLINLNYHIHGSQVKLFIRVKETRTRKSIWRDKIIINPDEFVSDSLKQISNEIATTILSLYPLQGKISKIENNTIHLNIGYDEGVRKNQRFKVKQHENVILKILTVSTNTSTGVSNNPINLKTGMEVIAYEEN